MAIEHSEITLDPDDWDYMRKLGHRMIDDLMTHLENIRNVDTNFPTEEAIQEILAPLSDEGYGEEETYEIFLKCLLEHALLAETRASE